jgi:hypothetical protein
MGKKLTEPNWNAERIGALDNIVFGLTFSMKNVDDRTNITDLWCALVELPTVVRVGCPRCM